MKPLIFLALLFSTSSLRASDGLYADQILHERVLVGESWNGTFLKSFYNSEMDVVRLQVCGEKQNHGFTFTGHCRELVPEMKYKDFVKYNDTLIERLINYREKYYQKLKSSLSAHLFNPEKDKTILALDKVITDLKQEGLSKWILIRKTDRGLSPSLTSDDGFKKILGEIKNVFTEPLPSAGARGSNSPTAPAAQ